MKAAPAIPASDVEKLAQEFKEFSYIVSHDLNTHLRAVVEFSKLLESEHASSLNDEGREYLSLILHSGEKLQTMVAALLDFSRLDTMLKPLVKVDSSQILENCLVLLKKTMTRLDAIVRVAPLPPVAADADQWMQLFLILLENALLYQPVGAKPAIDVWSEEKKGRITFFVRDNGVGIKSDYHTRIFKPFQRLHGEEDYAGIGMGLTLAKKIVARHGGDLQIDSIEGKGSLFQFTIPALTR